MELGENPWNGYNQLIFTLLDIRSPRDPGNLLLRNFLKALSMKEKHTATLLKFNADLSEDLLCDWADMIYQWERDKTRQNPYTHTEKGFVWPIAFASSY